MRKSLLSLVALCLCAALLGPVAGASPLQPRILFVPHDDRPVSFRQTAETLRKLPIELLTPPQELLGSRTQPGDPEALWAWLRENAPKADAAVLSSDALLYGSLVASRKHALAHETILARAEAFRALGADFPRLDLYTFGSIMRTPRDGNASSEEPSYYAAYGAQIFRLTALEDKAETDGLSRKETREKQKLHATIPPAALTDWMARREKNFAANARLIELAESGVFRYLALGRDDNAPHSQTHKESRLLDAKAARLDKSRFQTLAGIDEMAMLLLTRAANRTGAWDIPFVAVRYGDGAGESTVPTYSDEAIGSSVRAQLFAAGAIPVRTTKRADIVLLVNTNADGQTFEANAPNNNGTPRENTASFADQTEAYLAARHPVSIADIAFANGADNALLAALEARGALPRLAAYAGWNTANNSTGFAIGQGILAKRMDEADKNALLAVRLLDDWAYQANLRQALAASVVYPSLGPGGYGQLGLLRPLLSRAASRQATDFAAQRLPEFSLHGVRLDFPWNRMFETDVTLLPKTEVDDTTAIIGGADAPTAIDVQASAHRAPYIKANAEKKQPAAKN